MKLEYKILWIDNDDKIYIDHQSIIEKHLTDLGFTPIIEKGSDYNAFNNFISSLNQFDLFILVPLINKSPDVCESSPDNILSRVVLPDPLLPVIKYRPVSLKE